MKEHIREEEEEVFPIIEKLDRGESLSDGERRRLREEIEEMKADHEDTAELLERIAGTNTSTRRTTSSSSKRRRNYRTV
jgi:regulator of cell morphogenesis and NO signaling